MPKYVLEIPKMKRVFEAEDMEKAEEEANLNFPTMIADDGNSDCLTHMAEIIVVREFKKGDIDEN